MIIQFLPQLPNEGVKSKANSSAFEQILLKRYIFRSFSLNKPIYFSNKRPFAGSVLSPIMTTKKLLSGIIKRTMNWEEERLLQVIRQSEVEELSSLNGHCHFPVVSFISWEKMLEIEATHSTVMKPTKRRQHDNARSKDEWKKNTHGVEERPENGKQ